jgi:PAS domain-containing protein
MQQNQDKDSSNDMHSNMTNNHHTDNDPVSAGTKGAAEETNGINKSSLDDHGQVQENQKKEFPEKPDNRAEQRPDVKQSDSRNDEPDTPSKGTNLSQKMPELNRELLDKSPIPMMVCRTGKVVLINSAGMRLFGAESLEDVFEKPLTDFIEPKHYKAIEDKLSLSDPHALNSFFSETKLLRPNGSNLDAMIAALPHLYEGEPAIQLIICDVTSRAMIKIAETSRDAAKAESNLYQKRLIEAEEARESAETRNLDLLLQVRSLEESLQSAETDAQAAQAKVEALQGNTVGLQSRLDAALANSQGMKKRMETAQINARNAQEQLRKLQANAQSMQERADSAEANAKSMQEKMETAQGNAKSMQEQLDSVETSTQAMKERMEAAIRAFQATKKENKDLKEKLNEADQLAETSKSETASMKERLDEAVEARKKAETERSRIARNLQKFEMARDQARAESMRLQNNLKEAEIARETAQAEKSSLESRAKKAEELLVAAEEERKQFEEKFKAAEETRQSAEKENTELRGKFEEAEKQKVAAESDRTAAEQKLKVVEGARQAVESECAELRGKLEKVGEEAESMNRSLESRVKEAEERVAAAEKERGAVEEKLKAAEEGKQELQDKLGEAEKGKEVAESKAAEMQEKLKAAEEAKSEHQALKERLKEAEEHITVAETVREEMAKKLQATEKTRESADKEQPAPQKKPVKSEPLQVVHEPKGILPAKQPIPGDSKQAAKKGEDEEDKEAKKVPLAPLASAVNPNAMPDVAPAGPPQPKADGKKEKDGIFYLRPMLERVCERIKPVAEEKGLEMKHGVNADVPEAWRGDAMPLQQILIALTDNAVKFTEKGEVTLQVISEGREGDLVRLHFFIQDTGMGMSEADCNAINAFFNENQQAPEGASKAVGMGMTMVKKLLAKLDGTLQVEGKENQGTKVDVSVTLKAPENVQAVGQGIPPGYGLRELGSPAAQSAQEAAPAPAPAGPATSRLLLVIDETNPQEDLESMVAGFSLPLDKAAGMDETREALQKNHYGLVFMAVNLFCLGDVAQMIQARQELTTNGLPIIALLDQATDEEKKLLLTMGLDRCVIRPFDAEAVGKLLKEFLPEACPAPVA